MLPPPSKEDGREGGAGMDEVEVMRIEPLPSRKYSRLAMAPFDHWIWVGFRPPVVSRARFLPSLLATHRSWLCCGRKATLAPSREMAPSSTLTGAGCTTR